MCVVVVAQHHPPGVGWGPLQAAYKQVNYVPDVLPYAFLLENLHSCGSLWYCIAHFWPLEGACFVTILYYLGQEKQGPEPEIWL